MSIGPGWSLTRWTLDIFGGMAASDGALFWDHPILGVVSTSYLQAIRKLQCPEASHKPVHVLALSARSEAMVEKERPPPITRLVMRQKGAVTRIGQRPSSHEPIDHRQEAPKRVG